MPDEDEIQVIVLVESWKAMPLWRYKSSFVKVLKELVVGQIRGG